MGAAIGGLLVAVGFLTRVPVPARVEGPADLARAVPWFPVVGAGVGAVMGLVAGAVAGPLGAGPAAVVAVGVSLALTGAFHEDGLADTFDGLGGGRDADHALQIMRDSRLGTYGTAALVVALLLRVGLVAVAVELGPVLILAAVGALSRAAAIGVMVSLPAAGTDGLGVSYLEELRRWQAAVGMAVGVAIAGALLGTVMVPMLVGAAVAAAGVAWWAARKTGGVTGDVLGACQQLADLAALGVLVGLAG